jgi:hypothetical protein
MENLEANGKDPSRCMIEVGSHGTVTLQDDSGNIFKVNGQHLKVFLEPENLEEIDVVEFLQFKDPI